MTPTQRQAMHAAVDAHRWALDYLSTGAARSKVLDSIAALRAALAEPVVEPVGYASIEGLRQLQRCNGMSVWCESPSMWGPKEQAPPPPENLVAIYTAPRPMYFQEPVAWAHDRFIENDDGMRIGTDEPELQWGKYAPDDDGWFPLYKSPPTSFGTCCSCQQQWAWLSMGT